MIELKDISKTFKVLKRNKGLRASAKSLFVRDYNYIKALDGVSFNIDRGDIIGYIGPNGSGKSTSIKIMSGILMPDSGECVVDGFVPYRDRADYVRNIGVVFGQKTQLWWDVPVIDSFELLKEIYSVNLAEYKNNLDKLIEMLDLSALIKTPLRQLSLGQRMKCEIAASLLHSPKILFLDEPTIGLDAVSKVAVRNFISAINREDKTTVILTTHDMNDIEAVTRKVVLIGRGKIVLNGNLSEIKKNFNRYKTLQVNFTADMQPPDINGTELIVGEKFYAEYKVDSALISVDEVLKRLKAYEIEDYSVAGEQIEDIIIKLYKEYSI